MLDAASILNSVVAGSIGFVLGLFLNRVSRKISIRASKWFWNPWGDKRIMVFLGERSGFLSHEGEIEPMVHYGDAAAISELISFLHNYYDEVKISTKRSDLDSSCPIVSIGGPVSNVVTREAEQNGVVQYVLLGFPYNKDSDRRIGRGGETEVWRPLWKDGELTADVSYIARTRSKDPSGHLFILAGTYGVGTWGAVRYATSGKELLYLRWFSRRPSETFQQVLRVHVVNDEPSKIDRLSSVIEA